MTDVKHRTQFQLEKEKIIRKTSSCSPNSYLVFIADKQLLALPVLVLEEVSNVPGETL